MTSSGTFITTKTNYYNILGELVKIVDGRGSTTQFDYSDKWSSGTASCVSGSTFAYPTTVTYPAAVTDKSVTTYNACDGTTYSVQSQNDLNASRPGTVYAYDGLQRVTNISFPDGGSQQTDYGGTANPQVITRTTAVTASPNVSIVSASTLDGLGRVVQTKLVNDPDGATYMDTKYDALGRTYCISNPYRSTGDATYGITTQVYDALGRATQMQPPDYWSATSSSSPSCASVSASTPAANPSNKIVTTYSGNTTTTTDQAGKSRKTVADSLGRLTTIFEDPPGLNYETDYTYDALDNLLTVNQKGGSTSSANWRTRTFTYDGLSRLKTALNPESGSLSYTYDNNGNLLTKTSPKPNQTGTATVVATYSYDALNRLAQKSFNDGSTPTVKFGYDGVALTGCTTTPPALIDSNPIGNRTATCDGAGAESWSHDSMGRILSDSRTTNGLTATYPYTYNLDGSVKTVTYAVPGSNVETITYTQGGAGRPVSETSVFNGSNYTYVSAAHYAPNGALCGLSYYGWGAAQNVSYNNRFQPLHWHVSPTPWGGHSAPQPCQPPSDWTAGWIDFAYNYVDASGRNNGNVVKINNNVNHAWSQNFTYDSLNRIATAQTDGVAGNQFGCWAETYTIDAWGNLLSNAPNPTTQSAYTGCVQEAPANLTGAVQPNNRLSGFGYTTDAAGNLIADGVHTFTFDAENHLLSTTQSGTTVSYKYDGDGKRVQKSSGTLYWYGLNSEPLMETTLAGAPSFAYYYFNGRITNRRPWYHIFNLDAYVLDELGNTNLVSGLNTSGAGAWDYSDYYPYGGEWAHQSAIGNHYKFTGKERDPESNLDNFGARYMGSNLGRFMSADPLGGHQEDPQTLNKYAYVRNNPLNLTDPTGLDFYLQCQQQSATCGKDSHGNLVQGTTTTTTDANGNTTSTFNATVVTSASLQDPNSGNTATVNENGVQITTANGTSQGVFIDNTPASDIQGSGKLQGFDFHINGNCSGTCLTSGEFKFNGSYSRNDVRNLLYARGSFTIGLDFVSNLGMGDHPYSSQHRFGGPLNSPHLSVTNGEIPPVQAGPGLFNFQLNPAALVPVTGGFHVDAHSDLPHHTVDVVCAKTGLC